MKPAPPPIRLFPFFPQAGTLWQDLFTSNHVDLDPTSGIKDFNCTDRTYDGHGGHDVIILGFREQAIGVPIFAVLSGDVLAAHDGEPDMNTTMAGQTPNAVTIDHSDGLRTHYLHLKNGSVSVYPGQYVVAGTQLGLTGSSGSSTWPHLHFQTTLNGVTFEPSTGPCSPGQSWWASQTPVQESLYARSVVFSPNSLSGSNGYPFDQAVRTGSFVAGTSTVNTRLAVANLPPNSTFLLQFYSPSGQLFSSFPYAVNNAVRYRDAWFYFFANGPLNTLGTWTMNVSVNGVQIISAPFTVVPSGGVVNHAPLPLASVALDPPAPTVNDTPFCRVALTSLYRRDPDYDIVRYRYQWKVNGVVVRDIVSAALSDAIPKGSVTTGASVSCTVTPSDGILEAASATTTYTPCTYGLTSPNFHTASGGQGSVGVTAQAGCRWDATSNANWLTITNIANGSGSGTVTYSAAANTGYARNSTLTIAGKTFPVSQGGRIGSTDIDGDAKSELVVYRPTSGDWYARYSTQNYAGGWAQYQWGLPGDKPLTTDFDADGKSELTVYRPSTGDWFIRYSSAGYLLAGYGQFQWGATQDVPITGDFDGDGRTELTVYRPSTGVWFVRWSSNGYFIPLHAQYQWGTVGDVPLAADFDGDGRTDLTVYRPTTGEWFIRYSSNEYALNGFGYYQWGLPGDVPLVADFDGDRKTDLTVYRPTTGEWYIRYSSNGYGLSGYGRYQWGLPGDAPVVADFDADGKSDLTVYRPLSGDWYIRRSSQGYGLAAYSYHQWGLIGDFAMNSTPTELMPQTCGLEGTAKSAADPTSMTLQFENLSGQTRKIFWLDYSGLRQLYWQLAPGAIATQQTYVTHPWMVTNTANECIAIYTASPGPGHITLR